MKKHIQIIAIFFVIHCNMIFGTGHDTEHRGAREISLHSTSSNHDLTTRATLHDSHPMRQRQWYKKFCCCIYSKKTPDQAKQKARKYAQLTDPAKDTPTNSENLSCAQRYLCCIWLQKHNSINIETHLDNSPLSTQRSKPR